MDYVKAKAEKAADGGNDRWITPTGFSLNKVRYGDYPEKEKTAQQRGWFAYMNVGIPLIEERSDIVQPPPDVICEQTYVNRTDPEPVQWTNTVEFSISNTISWSLQGDIQLTFGARSTAQLQNSIQHSLAQKTSSTNINHNHKDNVGSEKQDQTEQTTTDTTTTTATGTGELFAQLMLGVTASVSGSLTTSWKLTSSLSGTIDTRAFVRATQRRQVKRFDYEIPIVFGGYVALYYPEPVAFASITPAAGMDLWQRTRVQTLDPKATTQPKFTQIIVHPIDILGLIKDGENFTQIGMAEVVSVLAGEHEVFELEHLQHGNRHTDNVEAPFFKPD
jgi:hypothetical protein